MSPYREPYPKKLIIENNRTFLGKLTSFKRKLKIFLFGDFKTRFFRCKKCGVLLEKHGGDTPIDDMLLHSLTCEHFK